MNVLVVIVNYKTPHLVEDCLRALAPEVAAVPGTRVVVTDNASGDGSDQKIPATIAANGWRRRPVIIEKRPEGERDFPNASEAVAIIDGQWKLIHNTIREPGRPEFELFDVARDPFDQNNVADQHPDVVQRLAKAVEGFRSMATAARLKPDSEATGNMTPEQLQRLRSLGYIR